MNMCLSTYAHADLQRVKASARHIEAWMSWLTPRLHRRGSFTCRNRIDMSLLQEMRGPNAPCVLSLLIYMCSTPGFVLIPSEMEYLCSHTVAEFFFSYLLRAGWREWRVSGQIALFTSQLMYCVCLPGSVWQMLQSSAKSKREPASRIVPSAKILPLILFPLLKSHSDPIWIYFKPFPLVF